MPVYKQYDKEALDKQYNNRLNVPDHEKHVQRWEFLSREAEKKYAHIKDIPYGKLAEETLTIFPSDQQQSKTLVFIHGGYWYKHAASDFYLVAEAFRSYGITTVMIDYPLMPGYSMDQLVLSCRRAIHWLQQNLSGYNADADQLYISGHSAGGHLTLMIMTAGSGDDPGLNYAGIKGVCAISGLYNLLPIQLCYVNDILKMDREAALRNSPVRSLSVAQCPLILGVGANETTEYHEQSSELYIIRTMQQAKVELLEIPGADHFSILETMLDPSSVLHRSMCQLMDIPSFK